MAFRRNVSDEERKGLMSRCVCLLYTPMDEHFGIVPVEAMAVGRPVVACSSGGPLETIEDGETGFLCAGNAKVRTKGMIRLRADFFREGLDVDKGPRRSGKILPVDTNTTFLRLHPISRVVLCRCHGSLFT